MASNCRVDFVGWYAGTRRRSQWRVEWVVAVLVGDFANAARLEIVVGRRYRVESSGRHLGSLQLA